MLISVQNCVYLLGKQVRTQWTEFGCEGPTHLPGLTFRPRARALHAAGGPLHMHFLKSPGATHALTRSHKLGGTAKRNLPSQAGRLEVRSRGVPGLHSLHRLLPAPSCPWGPQTFWACGRRAVSASIFMQFFPSVSPLLSLIWTPVTGLRANLDIPR